MTKNKKHYNFKGLAKKRGPVFRFKRFFSYIKKNKAENRSIKLTQFFLNKYHNDGIIMV